MGMHREDLDEALGIMRCARCGHRLDGEIECPVCSGYYHSAKKKKPIPKWVYMTAFFLTSPLSIYCILRTDRLTPVEKWVAASGCLLWAFVVLR